MTLSDDELKVMIRESIARHLGTRTAVFAEGVEHVPLAAAAVGRHASHVLLAIASGGDGDGACLIEPAVRCSHCGYCQSYGH